eukprot:SAG31_NODE_73_length_27793_cov_26.900520_3_plen_88_part_00
MEQFGSLASKCTAHLLNGGHTSGGEGDATACVRNLFNVPVIAYSGENDRQIQASRIMEEAYAREGKTLPHLIGPAMGHAVRKACFCH